MTSVVDHNRATVSSLLDAPPSRRAVDPSTASASRWKLGLRRLAVNRTLWVVTIGAVALAARLAALRSAYDIFIDEITYTNISLSVAHGHGVDLYGHPFALHPPAAFGLYALVILIFGLHGNTESVLFALRHVDAVLGTAVCVMTFLLTERITRRFVAVLVALLMALDPLAVSFDSRVMLEAPAQLAVVSLMFCLVAAIRLPAGSAGRRNWLLGSGLAAAVTLTTKETFGLVVLGALFLLFATGWVVTRREVARVTLLAIAGYAVNVVALGMSSGFGVWWNANVDGALRLVGARQITGFNSPTVHVSLVSRILADGSSFAVTYLILGVGSFCALGLLVRLSPWRRTPRRVRTPQQRATVLVALWTLAAGAYLVYATVFGTIEEQMYYILLLPSAISTCLWIAGFVAVRPRPWKALATVAVGLALVVDMAVWVSVHTGQDDEYARMVSWEATHVPPTSVVAATDGSSQFLLSRGIIGQWSTVPQIKAHHVDYVIVSTLLVHQGYGLARPPFAAAVERGGHLVFETDGVSEGSLRIYDVRGMTGGSR
jgi:4-amino-4-deoxy-L-arabinose transferase-like glycosyltransferase